MTIKITRTETPPVAAPSVEDTFWQWQGLRQQSDLIEERMDVLKGDMLQALEAQGYTDDRGHIWIDFGNPIDGFTKLKWELRVTTKLAPERAERILEAKGVHERCIVLVPTLDENEIMVCHAEGLLTDEDIDSMFVKKEIRAFKPTS